MAYMKKAIWHTILLRPAYFCRKNAHRPDDKKFENLCQSAYRFSVGYGLHRRNAVGKMRCPPEGLSKYIFIQTFYYFTDFYYLEVCWIIPILKVFKFEN
jgi:hypothetical protein